MSAKGTIGSKSTKQVLSGWRVEEAPIWPTCAFEQTPEGGQPLQAEEISAGGRVILLERLGANTQLC